MLRFLITGQWGRDAVRLRWSTSTRVQRRDIEESIDREWSAAKLRLQEHLFDGSMCRLERWSASDGALELNVSLTSYKVFLGTNLSDHDHRFPRSALANPVGVSPMLQSNDGFLLM